MRWILAIVSGVVAAAVLAPVCFFAVLILAGPHSSLLPSAIQPAVLVFGWIVVLGGPLLLARIVWRRARSAARGSSRRLRGSMRW